MNIYDFTNVLTLFFKTNTDLNSCVMLEHTQTFISTFVPKRIDDDTGNGRFSKNYPNVYVFAFYRDWKYVE